MTSMYIYPSMVMHSKVNRPNNASMASYSILIFFILPGFLSFTTTKAAVYLSKNCSSNSTTANSAFKILLSSLSSNATGNNQFYNTTVTGRDSSDSAYGLFMCRGDIPLQLCQRCVVKATQVLSSECSLSKQAVIWYDECMVRYSNHSFFSNVATTPIFALWNTVSVANPESFMPFMFSSMNKTADEAARAAVGDNKFATREVNYSKSQTLYCLAQCTQDLSPHNCRTCLSGVIGYLPSCCDGTQGGRVLNPSCNIRYEFYPFYRTVGPSPSPAPPLVQEASRPTSPSPSEKRKRKSRTIILIVILTFVSVMLLFVGYYFLKRKVRKSFKTILTEHFGQESATLEPLQFDLAVIEAATNNFSDENYIGKGGFGEVYKGILLDQRQIAVKRLSRSSGQGANEFKNEVLSIAKLQHRNLVAFIGFCLGEQEKILIYEYVPNKSLDYYLFDSRRQKLLSWFERYNIIGGIARGILYIHEHSRLKVIHRDLKPSNVLLDENMIPKISDFGLARIVEINQESGNTSRIVGTYGYMSPEYAMFGQFSEKSDVFSFGVMILEVITGKRNMCSHESCIADGLTSYVWRQWKDQTPLNILDSDIKENYSETEVMKCIQIGLLCVQLNPDARPTMTTVVSYITSHFMELPTPQEPAFFLQGMMFPNIVIQESSSSQSTNTSKPISINEMSSSEVIPR